MPTGSNYPLAIVILNRHEPEGETAGRLIELAEEKGYGLRVVEAVRGDHDAGLSFRVPKDVADAFDAERDGRWPVPVPEDQDTTPRDTSIPVDADGNKIENNPAVTPATADNGNEDAETADDDDQNTNPARRARPGKAKE